MTKEEKELLLILRSLFKTNISDYTNFIKFLCSDKFDFKKCDEYNLIDDSGQIGFALEFSIKDVLFCVLKFLKMKNFQ